MGKILCLLFGLHKPDKSLDVFFNCHCKYCHRDIQKINGHWRIANDNNR